MEVGSQTLLCPECYVNVSTLLPLIICETSNFCLRIAKFSVLSLQCEQLSPTPNTGSPRLSAASVNCVWVLRHLANNVINQIFGDDMRFSTLIGGLLVWASGLLASKRGFRHWQAVYWRQKAIFGVGKQFIGVGKRSTWVSKQFTGVGKQFISVSKRFIGIEKQFSTPESGLSASASDYCCWQAVYWHQQTIFGTGKRFISICKQFIGVGKQFISTDKRLTALINGLLVAYDIVNAIYYHNYQWFSVTGAQPGTEPQLLTGDCLRE